MMRRLVRAVRTYWNMCTQAFSGPNRARFEPLLSSNVSITWGARTHTFRDGGPLVESGPRLPFPRMAPGVRGLVRLSGSANLSWESCVGAAFRLSRARKTRRAGMWPPWTPPVMSEEVPCDARQRVDLPCDHT